MHIDRAKTPANQAKVVVVTADAMFDDFVRSTFGASQQIGLDLIVGRLADRNDEIDLVGATVVVADIDSGDEAELQALDRLVTQIGNGPPVVAIAQNFDASLARRLMQM